MMSIRTIASGLAAWVALSLIMGCSGSDGTGTQTAQKAEGGHAHGEGPHGGAVADWGGGKYHVEFTVDHDKQEATVYVLDNDAKKAAPINAKDGQISANITGVKDKDNFAVILKAMPQEGDPQGKASRFVGKHEKIGVVQEFEGTITGEDDGTPYTGKFKEEPPKD